MLNKASRIYPMPYTILRKETIILNTSSWIEQFMASTAWKMTPPDAYGPFHLGFAVVGFTVSFLLARKLKNLTDRGNRILILGMGLFLVACELYKQLFYYYYIEGGSYAWGIFPFHMCSVPMYLCIIAPLLKKGKAQKGMYNFMMIYNLLGGFITFFEPSGINLSYWTLTLHAYIWHMSLVFVGLYLAFSGRGGKEMTDYKTATITFIILCGVAFCINLLCWDVSGGRTNMFFVGPADSSLVVFKWISKTFGWYVSTLIYIPVVCLGAYLIFLPFHLYHRKKQRTVVS